MAAMAGKPLQDREDEAVYLSISSMFLSRDVLSPAPESEALV